MNERTLIRTLWPVVPILMAAVVITLLLLWVSDNPPSVTYEALWTGAFGSADRTFSTLAFWVPLLLCATGLLVTFTAGLWNIGVEGQMIMGAIGATWVALEIANRFPSIPAWVIIPLEILAAMGTGALWAALAAVLKTRGGVHEIFGGVALNSLAIIATNYLISGVWQPPEGGTFRGTIPFPENAMLPLYAPTRFSPLSLVLALIALVIVIFALRGTHWGLQLKALGKNLKAAFLLGVSSEKQAINSMMFCGALAGLAGAVRVLSWFDSLRQSISGGIGFLAILIVLLAGMRPLWTLVIALLFSALLNGGTIVQLRTQLHSSLSGIIQGTLVLFMLLFRDYTRLFRPRHEEEREVGS
jgi:simple sugar transport system permease protein